MSEFLDNHKLIREATRLGISVDELKSRMSNNVPSTDISPFIKAPQPSTLDSILANKFIPEQPKQQTPIKPEVAEYIQRKIASQKQAPIEEPLPLVEKPDDKYSDENYQKAKDAASSRKENLGWLQFAAGFGDAVAGRSPSESAKDFNAIRENIDSETIGQFNRDKNQSMVDFKNKQTKDTFDPNSSQSVAFRKMIEAQFPTVAKAYGKNWSQVSAADKENIFEPLKLRENIESRRQQAEIMQQSRQDKLDLKQSDKLDKKKTIMNEIEDRRQNINANLAQLKSMVDEDGTYEMFGSHNQDMDRLIEQISTDMAKLMDPNSVARPSEVEMIKKSLIKPGFSNRNSTAKDILNNFENEINRRADSAYKIRGLESPQGRPQAQEQGQQSNQKKPKTRKQNGHTYTLNEVTGEYE